MSVQPNYAAFEPARNEPCLCGSGKKFKKCCAERYGSSDNPKAAQAALRDGKFKEALTLTRAHFTQYLIWHRAHTVPFLASGRPEARELLEIDVSALAELLDQMFECQRMLGALAAFRQSLEFLAPLVDHPRWKQRIVYQRALSVLAESWDEEAGRAALAELGQINEVHDSEILELYLDLEGDRLGLGQRLALIDRVVKANRSRAVTLQYRMLRGLQLFLVGDKDGAVAEFRSAIDEYKGAGSAGESPYGALQLARGCALLASLVDEPALLDDAERLFRQLLSEGGYTATGLAMLWWELGDVLLDQGRMAEAKDAYLRSLEHAETGVGTLKVAKVMALLGETGPAQKHLDGLKYSELSRAEAFDYNVVAARIALLMTDNAAANRIAAQFERLDVRDPYFREIRLEVIAELRTQHHRSESEAAGFFAKVLRAASRYLILQPSALGLGVNINAMLEDIGKADSTVDTALPRPTKVTRRKKET